MERREVEEEWSGVTEFDGHAGKWTEGLGVAASDELGTLGSWALAIVTCERPSNSTRSVMRAPACANSLAAD